MPNKVFCQELAVLCFPSPIIVFMVPRLRYRKRQVDAQPLVRIYTYITSFILWNESKEELHIFLIFNNQCLPCINLTMEKEKET